MFSSFKWYREKVGGTWYYVRLKTISNVIFRWTQYPDRLEVIIDEEHYQ